MSPAPHAPGHAGHDGWIEARDRRRGEAAADELGDRFVERDVTRKASMDAAAEALADAGGLDVLVAGIASDQ